MFAMPRPAALTGVGLPRDLALAFEIGRGQTVEDRREMASDALHQSEGRGHWALLHRHYYYNINCTGFKFDWRWQWQSSSNSRSAGRGVRSDVSCRTHQSCARSPSMMETSSDVTAAAGLKWWRMPFFPWSSEWTIPGPTRGKGNHGDSFGTRNQG